MSMFNHTRNQKQSKRNNNKLSSHPIPHSIKKHSSSFACMFPISAQNGTLEVGVDIHQSIIESEFI